jgi:hypothetical protein
MKSRFIRVAALSALVATSPVLIFAAGQPKLREINKSEMQDVSGAGEEVQLGKGGGRLRRNEVSIASDYHLSTAKDLPALGNEPVDASLNRRDSAFRK